MVVGSCRGPPGRLSAKAGSPAGTDRTSVLQQYSPVGALINSSGDILYLHGRTGLYLEPAPGEAGMNILKMARDGLRRDLTAALHKAVASREPVRHPGLRVKTNGDFTLVDLVVQPVGASPRHPTKPTLFLVIFEKAAAELERPELLAAVETTPAAGEVTPDCDARIAALKRELQAEEESSKPPMRNWKPPMKN